MCVHRRRLALLGEIGQVNLKSVEDPNEAWIWPKKISLKITIYTFIE